MKRMLVGFLAVMVLLAAVFTAPGAVAQDEDDYEATIEALETELANSEATVAARGKKMNDYRTQIAELEENVPPTNTPAPELSGKDKYPYVGDPLDVFTRPFNYIGHNMSFCGRVGFIEVARPGRELVVGDENPKGFDTVVQVFVDGVEAQYMAGFDGDTTGINEDSYVCVWGTLIDTVTGTNTFGGTIVNPLFDAEYLELA